METFNIMAVDPGTNTLGVAVYTVSLPDLKIVQIDTALINLAKYVNADFLMENLLYRLTILDEVIANLIGTYAPLFLAIENSFINRLRPAAYGPLSQSISTIEIAATRLNPFIRIFKFAPSTIKKAVKANFKAGKDDVLTAVCVIDEITNLCDPTCVTEHEVDALAINYLLLNQIRDNDLLLLII